MRQWMIAGNWKMHNTIEESKALAKAIADGTKDVTGGDVVVAPVFTALSAVADAIKGSKVGLAAQNVYFEDKGAYTGEIAPAMLKDVGCQYAIIGHSERRKYFGETDESVNAKVKKTLAVGLKTIMCVGETEQEREQGVTQFVVGQQVKKGLYGITDMADVIVAYEPVWAIGTGKVATPQQAEEVHAFIRQVLRELYGNSIAEATRILYGGSVTKDNIGDLMSTGNIDGGLVGGASLKSDSFIGIITTVAGKVK
jgi:triosephosphate isomerase (TIM)